ncbi:hypothetical protein MBLNU230_g5059t1 [Neophaeotheca triangularis]
MTGEEQSKRSRPCDACRRRKSKCVTEEGSNSCVLCKFHDAACTFLHAAQPRKRPTSSPAFAEDSSVAKKRREVRSRPGPGLEIEEYDDLPGSVPTLLKRTLGLQNLHHSQLIGPNDVLHTYGPTGTTSQDASAQGGEASSSKETVRFVNPLYAFRITPDAATVNLQDERALVDGVEATVQGHGRALIMLYFRIVHPSFPVLHKAVYLEKYARSHREFSPPLLAAVYLLASRYWNYCEALSEQRKPDLSELQRLACASFQMAKKRPKLSTVQACLLFAQFHNAGGQNFHSRLTTDLVDLTYRLGLHLDASDWDIPSWEISLRRRLAWAVFMQDKWIALLEGHPSLLTYEDWEVRGLCEEDFPESDEDDTEGSSEVEKGRLVFTNMAVLAEILSEMLLKIFSARARRTLDGASNPFAELLERVKPLQVRLKNWYTTLPPAVRLESAPSMKLSPVGYLRLAYLAVEVCLHRQIIKVLPPMNQAMPATPIYRSAARERLDNAIDFIQRLQAQHIASFWFFASARSCALIYSFGQSLESTSHNDKDRLYFSKKLREFRWALKVNSEAGASFAKTALALIDNSNKVLAYNPTAFSTTTSPAQNFGMSFSTTPSVANDVPNMSQGGDSMLDPNLFQVSFDLNTSEPVAWNEESAGGFMSWSSFDPSRVGMSDGMG